MHTVFVSLLLVSLCTLLVSASACCNTPADLTLLDTNKYPSAKCLDGSAAGFYYRPGNGSDDSSWVIFFEGGGECVDEASCTSRASTDLGSSTNWPKTLYPYGPQSGNQTVNPEMYGYNMIFVKYCSGDLFSGAVTDPDNSTYGLYFSGHNIVDAIIDHFFIADPAKHKINRLVVSGMSAGGLGAFINMDYIADQVHQKRDKSIDVVGFVIGGYYWINDIAYTGDDAQSFIAFDAPSWKDYYALWQAFAPTRCTATYKNNPHLCMVANVSIDTLESHTFVVEAQTDQTVIPLHDGFPYSPPLETQSQVDYAALWSSTMVNAVQVQVNKPHGLFHPACWIHCGFTWTQPVIDNTNYMQAFNNWYFKGKQVKLIDSCKGAACNPTCPDKP